MTADDSPPPIRRRWYRSFSLTALLLLTATVAFVLAFVVLPRLILAENTHMFKTKSSFGSGGNGGKAIIVSQEMYRSILAHNLRGCYFQPVRFSSPLNMFANATSVGV